MIQHLSYSSISKYLKCHRQWKHKYIDEWEEPTNDNLLFGSAWHEYIRGVIQSDEPFNGNREWGNWNEVFHSYINKFKNSDNYEKLLAVGESISTTEAVYKTLQSLKPMPESIEKQIELHIPGVEVPIIGYIDMIEDGTMIPVDFKTASKKWTVASERNGGIGRAETELQATFYIAALEQAGMITLPHTFRYIIFTKTSKPTVQIIDTVRTAQHVFELHEMINDVWHGIKHKAFGKTDPGNWWCSAKWCSFYDRCKNGKA